jgi:hypothetical protein
LQPGLYASTWYITASKLNLSASQLLESMFTQEPEEWILSNGGGLY